MKVTDDKDREELAKKYEIPGKTFTWVHGYQRNHSDIKDRKHPDLWLKPPVEEEEKKHETIPHVKMVIILSVVNPPHKKRAMLLMRCCMM